MSIGNSNNYWAHDGDGSTTVFSYGNKILAAADLEVYVDGVLQSSGYTVSGAGSADGGSVTFATAPASGAKIVLRRASASLQPTTFRENDGFPASTANTALDRLTILIQQAEDEIGRGVRYAPGDPAVAMGALPIVSAAARANKSIVMDANGVNPVFVAVGEDASADSVTATGGTTAIMNAVRAGQRLTPEDFGAVGDGITDDTAALQAAIDAVAGKWTLYLSFATYRITAELDATGAALRMVGAGVNASVIRQDTDNIAILKVGTGGPHISDMQLRYNSAQAIGNTGANAIEFYGTNYGVFERLNLYRCNRGMYVPPEVVVSGGNYLFSCTIRDVFVNYYSNNGINLVAYNAGISGNVMSNIYLVGRDDAATALETNEGLVLGGWGNGVLNQINVEGSKPTEAMYFNTCDGLVLNAIHFESLTPRTDYGGFMNFAGGVHVVNNVQVELNTVNVANSFSIVRVSTINTKIRVTGVEEGSNTVTTPNFRMFFLPGTETGVECYAELVRSTGLTSEGFSASYPSKIRQYGTKYNVLDLGGNSLVSATSVPASGTWVTGDKCFNSAPASGEPLGWVCTTGGSPGTWQAFGILEGLTAYDANTPFTLTAGTSAPTAFAFGTLTADRAVSLAGGFKGAKFRVTRTAGGAFNLNVGTGPLKALAASEWCDVEHDGSSWVLTAFGSL